MLKNYFKTAWRNLLKSRGYSAINIGGLAVGMAISMLIGFWIYDEFSFNKNHKNYDRVAQVFQFATFGGEKAPYAIIPIPMGAELRNNYPDFKSVSLASNNLSVILANEDKKFTRTGNYVEPAFTEMMSFDMIKGSRSGLKNINSIMLSETLAKSLFGSEEPINKTIKIDNKSLVKVTGVYKDFPHNSSFKDLLFIAPWALYAANEPEVKNSRDNWENNSYQLFVQLDEEAGFENVSAKIKNTRLAKDSTISYKPEFFLHPMRDWHLYSDWTNGVKSGGGRIEFVWLFGMIGLFILLLACINFMNLSTARSAKRSREVGVRKAIGSTRYQLVIQFFTESIMVVAVAFLFALLLLQLTIPFFNEVADKKLVFLGKNGMALQPAFWIAGLFFILFTGALAGIYPAFYLSSFQPIKVLKGGFNIGRLAAIPRKVLVVVQFAVSIFLFIGTAIVFKQIQHAKNRPIGYAQNGLLMVNMNTPELKKNHEALKNDLLASGFVVDYAESSIPVTSYGGLTDALSWQGKDPAFNPLLGTMAVTHEFGKTINWQVSEGRDFSKQFSSDSSSLIINETAAKLIGLKNLVGQTLQLYGRNFKVIGIVKDMLMESPFQNIKPTLFMLDYNNVNVINVKMSPLKPVSESLTRIAAIFQKHNSSAPFDYEFVDDVFATKFSEEMRIGKLSSSFTIIAIFISCLGLFGLAAFIAEQRTKEIGIRKVLGASIYNVWKMLSKDFVLLVVLACFIAVPVSYYLLHQWLQKYEYRADVSWWIFAVAIGGAISITLLTVSFQAIKAAIANPVKSLRTE